MGKILKFKSKKEKDKEDVLNFLEELKKNIIEENIDNIIIGCKGTSKDKYILTGYCNLEKFERQEILSHLQIDIITDLMVDNYL